MEQIQLKMSTKERIERVIISIIFVLYILLLMKILFLSRVSIYELFDNGRVMHRSLNLVPFYSINGYMSGTIEGFSFGNVVGNFLIFMPLGVYLPLFMKDKRVSTNLFIIFMTTVLVEVLQWTFGIGAADIDDVILNFAGGLIGILGYKLFRVISGGENGVLTATLILSIIFLPVIIYLLFVINMVF